MPQKKLRLLVAVVGGAGGAASYNHTGAYVADMVAGGLFVIAAGNDVLFVKMCAALGLDQLANDPRFASNVARCRHVKILKRLIETVTLEHKKKHWITLLEDAGVPCSPIQDVAQAMADPQILARNMVIKLAAPDGGKPFLAAGNPIKISGMDDTLKDARAPLLDGDRQQIIDWLDAD